MSRPKDAIGIIYDNNQRRREVFSNLVAGDMLIAKNLVMGTGDVGASGLTYKYKSFIPGKEYTVDHTYYWGPATVAYIKDEEGCLSIATPEVFDLKPISV